MSDKLNEEKWPKTIKTLIIWSSTILLFISVFFPVEYFKSNALKEIAWGHKMIGEKISSWYCKRLATIILKHL